tara:strand:+ start:632 stop:994 length:363 start_codon:yes stop_codon:yes gene_type:complete
MSYKELYKSGTPNLIANVYSLKKELHEVKKEKLEQNWELQSLTKKFEELQLLTKKFEELESQIQKYLKDPKPITKEMGAMIDEILWDPHEYGECENCGVSMTEDDSLNGEGCCEACNTYG